MVIAIVVGVLLLAGLIIGLAVGLTRKKPATTPDAPTLSFCEANPSSCADVPNAAMNYIMSTFTNTNQIKAMLKLSQSFASFGATTDEDKLNAFHSALMATECLDYLLPNGHTAAYQGLIDVQLTTAADIQNYLDLANGISGQPFTLTPSAQLAARCSALGES